VVLIFPEILFFINTFV
jgi:hypothetical protein